MKNLTVLARLWILASSIVMATSGDGDEKEQPNSQPPLTTISLLLSKNP